MNDFPLTPAEAIAVAAELSTHPIRFNLASGKESANSGGAPSCLVSYSPLDTDYLAASGLGTLVYPPAPLIEVEQDVLDFTGSAS